jgi:hypothetical protein
MVWSPIGIDCSSIDGMEADTILPILPVELPLARPIVFDGPIMVEDETAAPRLVPSVQGAQASPLAGSQETTQQNMPSKPARSVLSKKSKQVGKISRLPVASVAAQPGDAYDFAADFN